jgi:putative DNA primase/helicase
MTVDQVLAKHGIKLANTAPGRYYTTCPHCSPNRSKEHQDSKVLGITIDNKGARWGCNHCGWTGPEKGAAGNGKYEELTCYIYKDADGVPRFRKVRNRPGSEPRFWLERANGGGWLKGTRGINTKTSLYRLDEVKKTIADGRIVACVEGEKDVDNLRAIGIAATCNAHGASEPGKHPKWIKVHSEQLAGADIIVFNDNDPAGYEHADATCKLSLGVARRVRRLDLAPHWPNMPKGADVSDWLALGHTREDLEALIAAAPDYAAKDEPPPEPEPLPSPSAPMAVARRFVESCCLHDGKADELTLRYWNGGWWTWRTTHWTAVEERTVRSSLYEFTEGAFYIDDKKEAKPWSPTRRKIGDLLEALSAIVILADDIESPCWTDGRQIDGPVVAVTNGLLAVATRELHAHSPLYFNQTSVPFDYDEDAPQPAKWLAFLEELWPQEPDAINVLGEWFGYVISGRLDLHKILLAVGPTRGGKGVIARILSALIGRRNVCGPTLNSLGGDFGLAPLLGKSLAVISDARFVGKNGGIVVERLLSISGEDTLTVNIKYREQWNGKLSCRLHVISNELPKLGDASTAIVGRFVLLPLSRSWLGKENHGLEAELRAELPGILNWSLDGLERLTFANGNRFTRVVAADEAIIAMRDLASPVGAFVRECCVVSPFNDDGSNREIGVDDLYAAYKSWCEGSEHTKSSKAVFGRDLRAAVSSVRKSRPWAGSRKPVYVGVSLRTPADDAKAEAREAEMPL